MTDLQSNTLSFLDHDPAAPRSLVSRDGAPKLKVKSAMTPEAKARVVLKPKTPAATPGPATQPIRYESSYRQQQQQVAVPVPVTPAPVRGSTVRLVPSQTPMLSKSDSLGSMDGYALPGLENHDPEGQGHTEAVSVTVRLAFVAVA